MSGVLEDDHISFLGKQSVSPSPIETPLVWIGVPPISFEARWNARYEELAEYKREHGNCLVPQTYEINPALGRWVRSQRVEYSCLQKGLAFHITQDRIDKLNGLGFVWDAKEAIWNDFLDELRLYKEKFGTLHVPQNDEEHKKLALWVRNQRMHYGYIQRGEENKSALTPERIKSLEDLGFIWDVNDVIWMEKFDMLKDLLDEFGHIPASCNGNQKLARWCAQQRYQYKNLMRQREEKLKKTTGSLNESMVGNNARKGGKICISQQRINLLNQIGFVWDPSDAYWWKQYAALKEYQENHGVCAVPVNYLENPQLGHWVANQKRLCREYTSMVIFQREQGKNLLPISGLNEKRLKALRDLKFEALPSIQKLNALTKEAKSSTHKPVPHSKQKEQQTAQSPPEKDIIPFPWDEI